MKIIHRPKVGRVPERYSRDSSLDYQEEHPKWPEKWKHSISKMRVALSRRKPFLKGSRRKKKVEIAF